MRASPAVGLVVDGNAQVPGSLMLLRRALGGALGARDVVSAGRRAGRMQVELGQQLLWRVRTHRRPLSSGWGPGRTAQPEASRRSAADGAAKGPDSGSGVLPTECVMLPARTGRSGASAQARLSAGPWSARRPHHAATGGPCPSAQSLSSVLLPIGIPWLLRNSRSCLRVRKRGHATSVVASGLPAWLALEAAGADVSR
jgi:hypothetical protein